MAVFSPPSPRDCPTLLWRRYGIASRSRGSSSSSTGPPLWTFCPSARGRCCRRGASCQGGPGAGGDLHQDPSPRSTAGRMALPTCPCSTTGHSGAPTLLMMPREHRRPLLVRVATHRPAPESSGPVLRSEHGHRVPPGRPHDIVRGVWLGRGDSRESAITSTPHPCWAMSRARANAARTSARSSGWLSRRSSCRTQGCSTSTPPWRASSRRCEQGGGGGPSCARNESLLRSATPCSPAPATRPYCCPTTQTSSPNGPRSSCTCPLA